MTMIGVLASFSVLSHAAAILDGWIEFPPSKTRTFNALMQISRAYLTHGKGRSWNVQTQPMWTNMDITESDYNFMLAHRGPADKGANSDEITSRGYFCAKVTAQQAGNAVRILHAGSTKLPAGTVILCPAPASP